MDIKLTEKQSLVITSEARFCGFGGQAGGGKSVTIRAFSIMLAMEIPNIQVYVIRKSLVQLRQGFMLGPTSYPVLLREFVDSGHVKINHSELKITFWNGSTIILKQLADAHDESSFLGLEVNYCFADEFTTMDERFLRAVVGRIRTGSLEVPDKWKHKVPGATFCTNPGGPSHEFFKKWFLSKAPPMTVFEADEEFGGGKSIFIPCSLWENPHLDQEEYAKTLKAVGDPLRIRQLLYGDFDAGASSFFAGAFSRERNVISDFDIPKSWAIHRSFDPGFSSPFGYVLTTRVKGENTVTLSDGTEKYFPNGSIIVYREYYGWNGKDNNVGLRMPPGEIALEIKAREEAWGVSGRVKPGRADVNLWNAETNAAQEMEKYGIRFIKADKRPGSRIFGAQRMRKMMSAAADIPVEYPALFFVDKCVKCIETIPTLECDPKNPDDVVTENVPDHLYDALRYEVATDVPKAGIVKTIGL